MAWEPTWIVTWLGDNKGWVVRVVWLGQTVKNLG